jgi:hypothetical protein
LAVTDPRAGATETPQRVGLGWRVAGAFVRKREASIFIVLLLLILYFSVRTDAFFGRRTPA